MRVIFCLVTTIAVAAALVATTASAGRVSACQTNHTFQQAARNGALPGVYAALHGSATSTSLNCSLRRQ